MNTYIGIDLGGTNARVALVSEDGKVLDLKQQRTEIELGKEQVVQKLVDMIASMDLSSCKGLGVGVPGLVDESTGTMIFASNLPGFEGFPIVKELQKHFDYPAYVINDVNAAGLAEALVGAGKGKPTCVYVTISTGIAAALAIDGNIHIGKHGFAGEVGNLTVDRTRVSHNNLVPGAIEAEASGTALVRKAKQQMPSEVIEHAGDLFQLASLGNKDAEAIADEFITDMAQMLGAIGLVVDPDIFVFGGGVMSSKEYFFDKLYERYASFVHKQMIDVEFSEASLDEPGIVGAAMQAMSKTR